MTRHLIVVVVDKHSEEKLVKKIQSFDTDAGVVLVGRGTGDPNQLSILGIKIEPEKRVFFVVTKADKTKLLIDKLNEGLNLEEVNKGIAFSIPVKQAIGLEE